MPYNHKMLELRLENCDKNLNALFDGQEIGQKLQRKIKAVQDYYNLSYTKATSPKTVEAIASSYELFVDQLTKVKNGELDRKQALEKIEIACESRKMKNIFQNLAKACELLFLAATTFSLWAGIFGLALPVMIVQPVMGVAVAITIIGAMLAAGYKTLSCLAEFKTSGRHDAEYNNEVSLVSFFKPAPKEEEHLSQVSDEELEQFACCI